jgi:hypothetical protein
MLISRASSKKRLAMVPKLTLLSNMELYGKMSPYHHYIVFTLNYTRISHCAYYPSLLHRVFDLCEQAPQVDKECPIEQGDFTANKTVALPKDIPPVSN